MPIPFAAGGSEDGRNPRFHLMKSCLLCFMDSIQKSRSGRLPHPLPSRLMEEEPAEADGDSRKEKEYRLLAANRTASVSSPNIHKKNCFVIIQVVLVMADLEEYRCFIGNLSWSTTDESLKDAFGKFGNLTEAKVVLDKFSGRSRGFGFVTFDEKKAMEDAIDGMNGFDLDGRAITVDKAQPQGPGRDRNGDRDYDRERGSRYDRGRDYGGGGGGGGRAPRGSGGGDCFKCGKPGHFARECPSGDGGRGDRYGGRDDRYGGGGRYGSDRGGDRYSGRSRDGGGYGGSGGDRYNRDRSGPY